MPEVKPCFACQSEIPEDDQTVGYPHGRVAVRCPNCKVRGPWFKTEKAAIAGWNSIRRPQDPHDRDYVWTEDVEDVLDDFRKSHEADVYREDPLKGIRTVLSRLEGELNEAIREKNKAQTAVDHIQAIRDATDELAGRWGIQKEDPTPAQVRKLIRKAHALQHEVDAWTEAEKERLGSTDWDSYVDPPTLQGQLVRVLKALDVPIGEFDWSESGDVKAAARHGLEQVDGLKDETRFKPAFRKVAKALMDYSEPPKRADKVAGDMIDRIRTMKRRASKMGRRKERLVEALDREDAGWTTVDDPTWNQIIEGVEWAVDHICQAPHDHDVLAEIRTAIPRVDQEDIPKYLDRYRKVAFQVLESLPIDDPVDWGNDMDSIIQAVKEAGTALDIVDRLLPHRGLEARDGELDIDEVWEGVRANTYLYEHAETLGQRWKQVCKVFSADPNRPQAALQRMRQRESIARAADRLLSELAELVQTYGDEIKDHEQNLQSDE